VSGRVLDLEFGGGDRPENDIKKVSGKKFRWHDVSRALHN